MHITDIDQCVATLSQYLRTHQPLTVLTGAGLSTASGIPSYRDEHGNWQQSPPVQHQQFMQHHHVRQRYWARSIHGWPTLYEAQPNAAHEAIQQFQQAGYINTIITQNVDGLQQRAGSHSVINLHGDANQMRCMQCGELTPRLDMHQRSLQLNPAFADHQAQVLADGDADLELDFSQFQVPACRVCDGILKPDVVYFGDNVPRDRVEQAQYALANSGGLLVIGSSLMVFSGFRFARQAAQAQQPLILLNRGKNRAEDIATVKLDSDLSATLLGLVAQLLGIKPAQTDRPESANF